jgi:hypothetical protein
MTSIVFLSIDNAHPPTLIVNNPPHQKCRAVRSYIYGFNNVKLGSYLSIQKHGITKLQLLQSHSAVFECIYYSRLVLTYKLECWRISALGQKRLEILVFDTQCFLLIEYTGLTAKYLNLWLLMLLRHSILIIFFHLSNLYCFAVTLSYTKKSKFIATNIATFYIFN